MAEITVLSKDISELIAAGEVIAVSYTHLNCGYYG